MGALMTLVVALAWCGLVLLVGPGIAEWLDARLAGGDDAGAYAVLETVFALVIFGPLLAAALVGSRIAGLNPLAIGRSAPRLVTIGAALGAGGLGVAAGYAWVAGALVTASSAPTGVELLLWGTLLILFMTGVEEVYFRGWLQPVLARRFGSAVAVLLSALAFAALHSMGGARSPVSILNLFLGGLLFGVLAARGGGIGGAVAAHFAWNWSEQIGLGLDPNPGVGSFGALADLDLVGPAWWGGSDEGLNASIAMTLALVAMLVPLLILATTRALGSPAATRTPGAAQA